MNGRDTRIAWVTGAGKGIGRALVKQLVQDGWTVAVSARSSGDLDSLAAEHMDGAVLPFPLDVTDQAAVEAGVAAIENTLGVIDLAVLNAGTHVPDSAASLSVVDMRFLMETNFMGTVNSMTPVLNRFLARNAGQLAIVASLAGYRGLPYAAGYGASKAALINMCESLKPELDAAGISLSLINPGFVKTPLTDKNDFPMPFLMPVQDAAREIVRGLAKRRFEISFPWRFALMIKLLKFLPNRLYFAITRRMVQS